MHGILVSMLQINPEISSGFICYLAMLTVSGFQALGDSKLTEKGCSAICQSWLYIHFPSTQPIGLIDR